MTDTLILGGGLAGCAAALWLSDLGHSATIVEARPDLGGRARSREWGDCGDPVEYGGGWIRADHRQMLGLADRLGLTLTPRARVTAHSYFRGGNAYAAPADDLTDYTAALATLQTDVAALASDTTTARAVQSMTLTQYFDHRALPADLRREILAWWSISGSGDPATIAATELLSPKLTHGFLVKLEELAFTVAGGVTGLVNQAAKVSGAGCVCGDPVLRLDTGGDGAVVTLASGRVLQARTALVALPLNAYRQIRFAPPLAPPLNRLRQLGHAGRAVKVLIRARGPEPGHLATGETAGLRWIYADRALPDGTTLVIGFGLYDEVGEPGRPQIATALTAAFPGAELLDFDWHDWCADPYALGTWVAPVLASLPDFEDGHWAARGNLAFAGSDLYSAEQGWFEGALLTARTAVAALNERLKKA